MSIQIKWFDDSPDVNTPEFECSLCGEVIENFAVRIHCGEKDCEARFHQVCYESVSGLIGVESPTKVLQYEC